MTKFEECVKKGGEIKTRTIPGKKYQRICYIGKDAFPDLTRKKKSK